MGVTDYSSLVSTIKQLAVEAVVSGDPTTVVYGVVVNDNPVEISIEQKIKLGEMQLVLLRGVTDYELEATFDMPSNVVSQHSHIINCKSKVVVHNKLEIGENVMLVRVQGGQKYIVVDRLVSL